MSVCQVPKSLSRDAVIINIVKKGLKGRVIDLVTVARTEQDRNLTRWIVWLESTEAIIIKHYLHEYIIIWHEHISICMTYLLTNSDRYFRF